MKTKPKTCIARKMSDSRVICTVHEYLLGRCYFKMRSLVQIFIFKRYGLK